MTDEDLKKITKALDEKLKPLIGEVARVKTELSESKITQFRNYSELSRIGKDISRIDSLLENINEELGQHTQVLGQHTKRLNALWDQVVEITEDLEDVKETQKSHTTFLKGTGIKVENNSDNIEMVDKRLTKVENRLGIVPPPELTM